MITSEKLVGKLTIFVISVLVSVAGAVEKPTSPQKTCVTEECHSDYGNKAYVHGPVGLGDCKSCHKLVDPNEHTWRFVRKGKDLCEYAMIHTAATTSFCSPRKQYLLIARIATRPAKTLNSLMGLWQSESVRFVMIPILQIMKVY
jgi:hypothetical protein